MRTFKEFVAAQEPEWDEENRCWGFRVFEMESHMADGKLRLNAIAGGFGVSEVYQIVSNEFTAGADEIYLAVDMAAQGDMKWDFICCYHMKYGWERPEVVAKLYDPATGSLQGEMGRSFVLETIRNNAQCMVRNRIRVNSE